MANEIIIPIDIDTDPAKKDLKKFEKTAKKSAEKMRKSFFTVGNALKVLVAGFALKKLLDGINKVTQAAIVQEDAINELNTALKASGEFSAEASEDLQAYASELQGVSKFGDEAILSTMGLIQSIGQLDRDALKGATKATVDMAAALKIDLRSAAVLMGKAATGEIGSLSRYGLIVKRGADQAETFANVLDTVNKKFGGAAKAQLKTYSGAVSQMSMSFGDLQEEIGFAITKNKAIITIINEAAKFWKILGQTIKENRQGLVDLATALGVFLVKGITLALEFIRRLEVSIALLTRPAETAKAAWNTWRLTLSDWARDGLKAVGAGEALTEVIAGNEEGLNKAALAADRNLEKSLESTQKRKQLLQELVNKSEEFEQRVIDAAKNSNQQQLTAHEERLIKQSEADLKYAEFLKELKAAQAEERKLEEGSNEERMTMEFDRRLETMNQFLTEEEELKLRFQAQELILQGKHAEAAKKIEEVSRKKKFAAFKKEQTGHMQLLTRRQEDEVSQTSAQFGQIAQLGAAFGRKGYRLQQAASIGQATMDTFTAANKALAQGGFFGGPFMAAVVTAMGIANVARIASTPPPSSARDGLSEVPQDNMTFVASKGERIVDTQTNRDLKDFLRSSVGGSNVSDNSVSIVINGDTLGDSQEMKESLANAVADAFEFQNVKREFVGAIT